MNVLFVSAWLLNTTVVAAATPSAGASTPNTGAEMSKLQRMLDERIQKQASKQPTQPVDETIKKTWEQPLAVLISDMSGFTELTQKRGIIGFLTEIRRLQNLATPIISKNGGRFVKADADDLFVTHASPKAMLQLARELRDAVSAQNAQLEDKMGIAIGLGFGPVLAIGTEDIFGDPVNVASKLGEDTAKSGEILVGEAFYKALDSKDRESCSAVKNADARYPHYACH